MSQDLPSQLPEEKLAELTKKVREGTASREDYEELTNGYLRLATYVANQYARKFPHLKDVLTADAYYGLALALSRATEKLYDDDITRYIVRYMHNLAKKAIGEDNCFHVPYRTQLRRKKLGMKTFIPKQEKYHRTVNTHGLYELKDQIEACIRNEFEREIIELRKLGYRDQEIADKLKCSRSKIQISKMAVYERFQQYNDY